MSHKAVSCPVWFLSSCLLFLVLSCLVQWVFQSNFISLSLSIFYLWVNIGALGQHYIQYKLHGFELKLHSELKSVPILSFLFLFFLFFFFLRKRSVPFVIWWDFFLINLMRLRCLEMWYYKLLHAYNLISIYI